MSLFRRKTISPSPSRRNANTPPLKKFIINNLILQISLLFAMKNPFSRQQVWDKHIFLKSGSSVCHSLSAVTRRRCFAWRIKSTPRIAMKNHLNRQLAFGRMDFQKRVDRPSVEFICNESNSKIHYTNIDKIYAHPFICVWILYIMNLTPSGLNRVGMFYNVGAWIIVNIVIIVNIRPCILYIIKTQLIFIVIMIRAQTCILKYVLIGCTR